MLRPERFIWEWGTPGKITDISGLNLCYNCKVKVTYHHTSVQMRVALINEHGKRYSFLSLPFVLGFSPFAASVVFTLTFTDILTCNISGGGSRLSQRGTPTPKMHMESYYLANSSLPPENCMKSKEIRMGGHPWHPLGSANEYLRRPGIL